MDRLKMAQTAVENAGKVLDDLGGTALSPLARKKLSEQAKGDLTIAQVQVEDYIKSHEVIGSEPEEDEETTEEEEENEDED